MHVKATLILGFAATVFAACASRPPTAEHVTAIPPAVSGDSTVVEAARPTARSMNAQRSEVAFTALSLIGTPYAAEGASPEEGFDCSGLVTYVYARALQLALPRHTTDLARSGVPVAPAELQPGDLVFYDTSHRPFSHVGIYLGESRFVHAPSTGGVVRVENMRVGYWTKRFNGARRVVQ